MYDVITNEIVPNVIIRNYIEYERLHGMCKHI